MVRYLTVRDVTLIHIRLLERERQVNLGVRDPGLLESAVLRPRTEFYDEEAFPTLSMKAAALLHALATYHVFIDGNKRVALAATMVFLEANGANVHGQAEDILYDFVLDVTTHVIANIADIAARIDQLFAGQMPTPLR